MKEQHLITKGWSDYELLDSGENMKLERFGDVVVARPETQALWEKVKPELWRGAHAEFHFAEKKGGWKVNKSIPESWVVAWQKMRLSARLTSFKHTGIFPEQEQNWSWIHEQVSRQVPARKQSGPTQTGDPRTFSQQAPVANILNLFGYTGAATIVAAQAGATVTHVDASKQSVTWASDNAKLSGVESVRWIVDDALAFVKREVRRGTKYDGIILDPPSFGRGAKGEVWHIEEHLPTLLAALKELLADKPGSFFLLNGYAAGYAPLSFVQAIESVFGKVAIEAGELRIQESGSERKIPSGIYVRFVR